jgi:hypothetical protein
MLHCYISVGRMLASSRMLQKRLSDSFHHVARMEHCSFVPDLSPAMYQLKYIRIIVMLCLKKTLLISEKVYRMYCLYEILSSAFSQPRQTDVIFNGDVARQRSYSKLLHKSYKQ